MRTAAARWQPPEHCLGKRKAVFDAGKLTTPKMTGSWRQTIEVCGTFQQGGTVQPASVPPLDA